MIFWLGLMALGLALALTALATPLSRRVAGRFGMLDVPGRHKTHARPVPLLGGAAVFLPVMGLTLLAAALCRYWAATGLPRWLPEAISLHVHGAAEQTPAMLGILLGALGLHVVGILDDARNLGPWLKLLVEAAVCTCVVLFCDVRILEALGQPTSGIVTVLWLMTITNAFNFLDNMDGLSAGVAAICCAAMIGVAAGMGQIFVPIWLAILLGSLLGYLLYNFPPASTFMGDAGSLVIGFLLGVMSCRVTYVRPGETYYTFGMFVPLVLMAVPLYDTVSVLTLRLRDRRNPMVGDRRHFSHRLVRRGMSQRTAVLTIYLCTAVSAISSVILMLVDSTGPAVLVFVQTLAVLGLVALLEMGSRQP